MNKQNSIFKHDSVVELKAVDKPVRLGDAEAPKRLRLHNVCIGVLSTCGLRYSMGLANSTFTCIRRANVMQSPIR